MSFQLCENLRQRCEIEWPRQVVDASLAGDHGSSMEIVSFLSHPAYEPWPIGHALQQARGFSRARPLDRRRSDGGASRST